MRKLWERLHEYSIPSPSNTFRPYFLRKPWLIFFLTIVLTAEGVFVASIISQQETQLQPAAVVPAEVIAFTNVERAREHETLLQENYLLATAAQAKAEDMARTGYFAHVGPDGKEPWRWIDEVRYSYRYAGENLAVRFNDSADVVTAWMASPTHRANIVKNVYQEIGVGVAKGTYKGENVTFVVQYFATPSNRISDATTRFESAESSSMSVRAGQVAAAAAAVSQSMEKSAGAQPHTQTDSTLKQITDVLAGSSSSTSWVLGSVLLIIMLLLALAFFIHVEIQSHEILMGGVLIGGTALLFLVLNMHVSSTHSMGASELAGAGIIKYSILVGDAAATGTEGISPDTQTFLQDE